MKRKRMSLIGLLLLALFVASGCESRGTGALVDGYYPQERGERVTCVVSDRYMQSKNIWRSILTCEPVK